MEAATRVHRNGASYSIEKIGSDDLTLLSNLTVTLTSASPGTTAFITATGAVTLGGSFTVVATGTPYPAGKTYLIIDNDGTDPIIGTFLGLPEGSLITSGGQLFSISYVGGSGNDVVLTAVAAAAAAPVPTLGSIGLIAFAVLLGAVAITVMRS